MQIIIRVPKDKNEPGEVLFPGDKDEQVIIDTLKQAIKGLEKERYSSSF